MDSLSAGNKATGSAHTLLARRRLLRLAILALSDLNIARLPGEVLRFIEAPAAPRTDGAMAMIYFKLRGKRWCFYSGHADVSEVIVFKPNCVSSS